MNNCADNSDNWQDFWRETIHAYNKHLSNHSSTRNCPITAPTKKATARMLTKFEMLVKSFPNKANRKTIFRTPPKTEPSLWVLAPRGIIVSAISFGTPIFLTAAKFTECTQHLSKSQ